MATIVLGCDKNSSNDSAYQNTVASILKKAGHKVEKLPIGPNHFAKYSYSKKSKGKIGIFLIAAGLTAIADAFDGNIYFKYCYFGIRSDVSKNLNNENDFKTRTIRKDKHGDCISKSCNKLAGKTFIQINEIIKSKCQAVFGTSPENMGDNLVSNIGGETNSSSNSNDSGSTIKEALTDVLYGWDGEAECFIRDDTVYIRKIPSPSKTKLSLVEGDNIDYNSVNVSDYNPSTVNKLSCDFKDYTLSIQDDYLIKRFGTISSTVTVDKTIKKLDDAKEFLQREWNKLKRDNGHVLELKTKGHSKWKQGRWCRVYLPSFGIDDYMYITKVSQDDSGVWDCNLTLVDYPPSFGEPTTVENDEEDSS